MNLNTHFITQRSRRKYSVGSMMALRISSSICCLFMLLGLLLIPTFAHCSISIMPLEAKLEVARPGARQTNDIEVYNNGDEAIHVITSVMDWSMTLSGQKQFHEAGTQPLSCAKWIQMNPVEFTLPPKKSMRVRYSVASPVDMVQEHHAMIFFTARAVPKASDSRFALNVQTRMGCKVLIAPAGKATRQGKITGMQLHTSPAPEYSGPVADVQPVSTEPVVVPATQTIQSKLKVTFVNTSAVSLRLNGTVEARSSDGTLVARGAIMPANALVLVGATRELWAQFAKPLPPGTYQIKAAIDYGAKELVGGTLKATVKLPDTIVEDADNSAIR